MLPYENVVDYDDFDRLDELTEELIELDSNYSLGITFHDARNFAEEVSRYENLWDDFNKLAIGDKQTVIEIYSDEYTGDVDARGLIYFLQHCPGAEIFYLPGIPVSKNLSIVRMRNQLGLEFYPHHIDLSDELVTQIHSFASRHLFSDISAAGVAIMLDSQRDESALVEILRQANRSKIELSSYLLVYLIINWDQIRQYPVDWSIQLAHHI